MKSWFKILLPIALIILFIPKAHAIDIKNNYQGYSVSNQRYEDVEEKIKNIFSQQTLTIKKMDNVSHAYYEVTPNNEHYYIRFYPAKPDTNIYIVSQDPINLQNNRLTNAMDSLSYSYDILRDKKALREYKFDFIELARTGAFDGFFLLPDCIKPLKKTVSNVNNYVNKKHKKKTLAAYSPDSKEIYLTLLDTKEYNSPEIKIVSNEYRLNQKSNKYVHAFEYMVYNKTSEPLTLKSVTGESVASLRDVETAALADLDKLNLLDTAGTLLAIPTAGTSLAMKVPNYMRILKMTKETKRYTKGLPENQTIEPNSSLRILTLKYKQNPKPLEFTFEKQGQEFKAEL